jgi:membrane dipeptidase
MDQKLPLADWRQVHRQANILDLHAHPSMKVSMFHRLLTARLYPSSRAFDPFSMRTDYSKLEKGGVDALMSVIYAPERGIVDECRLLGFLLNFMPRVRHNIYERPYFELTLELMDEIEKAAEQAMRPNTGKPWVRFAHNPTELEQIIEADDGTVAMVHCIEGAHCLEGKLENLELLARRGVAYMILAHFFENELVHPCFPWPETVQKLGCFQGERNIWLGLKPFGEQAVEKMVELGMLVDVSHCTPPARKRVYEIVGKRAPILATHVGAYEINPDPYNLQDWEIRTIAESGGVVGVIFMNYWLMPRESHRGLNFISRTIDHVANVGGIDHVGIGTDFDGFTDPPDDLKDASELPRLTQRLLVSGYSPEDIAKILGGNALRALRQGWKGAAV